MCIVYLLVCSTSLWGQNNVFNGSIVVGGNFSQIDGDDLAGYHHLGLNVGVGNEIMLRDKIGLRLELLYSQVGSGVSIFGSNDPMDGGKINLSTAEIPLSIRLYDWYFEDSYYKVSVSAGLQYSYLFGRESTNTILDQSIVEDFSKSNAGFHLGATYRISKKLSLNGKYSRNFTALTYIEEEKISSYFLSFRMYYHL